MVKNNVVTDFKDRVLYLSPTVEGKVHDKAICDDQILKFPADTCLWQDTGFQGHSPEGAIILQPMKKPRGKALTVIQRTFNRTISALRVWVEHAIGGVKRSRIVKDCFRGLRSGYRDQVMEIACGLHNFRIACRPSKKAPVFYCEWPEQKKEAT